METEKQDYIFDYDGENFTTMLDGKELVGCQWIPKNGIVRYVLIFFHGLGAFVTINRPFWPKIIADGGAIFGTDHFGHGRSPGDRGNNTREMLHAEITLLLKRARVIFPDIPIFVYGHSMGGVAILSYVLTHPIEENWIEGIIVEAPWIATHEKVANSLPHKILSKLGRYIFPSLVIDTGNDFDTSTYPKQFIQKFLDSNLPHDYITPRLFASASEMQEICRQQYKKWPLRLPLLFMQGGLDNSVGKSVNYEWIDEIRDYMGGRVKIVFHENAEHAMLRKDEGPIIIDEVIDYINNIITRSPDLIVF
ncbi:Clan SC, family S33, methylesterase-like serine peptidase [Trichomonas vaginalis G3]|uniref:Clan SC, family S33, methylesterase-like serine peptidase n=1 Tax=Trichomonas vaginalis (strain ATCC PRA-98 / G3) TaxID=412133 RepID=A2FQQ2_TRIV3|nr:acylglycerol lipase protein [Trichomonas vaginalis G3]EAX92761.1 Clan SC, family S33, methylesterase-like serine peptidase [Trichomonas vaginalis G3]KAI5498745.1 acylglycerol lipase protein [Trichomonas vaginalis G3]|eukprot:XP_001305691.1 Clan SC, family S33, methylesterase-like serine peptidase [Trichomonas vaginalis G3]